MVVEYWLRRSPYNYLSLIDAGLFIASSTWASNTLCWTFQTQSSRRLKPAGVSLEVGIHVRRCEYFILEFTWLYWCFDLCLDLLYSCLAVILTLLRSWKSECQKRNCLPSVGLNHCWIGYADQTMHFTRRWWRFWSLMCCDRSLVSCFSINVVGWMWSLLFWLVSWGAVKVLQLWHAWNCCVSTSFNCTWLPP